MEETANEDGKRPKKNKWLNSVKDWPLKIRESDPKQSD